MARRWQRAGLAAVVVAATASGWVYPHLRPQPAGAPPTPAAVAPPAPGSPTAAAPVAPAELPDYAGVIERVEVYPRPAPAGRPVLRVLVRYTQPGRPPDSVWVWLDNAVLEQNGAHLEVGSAVRVWAPGGVAGSGIGQVSAEYIVCEPPPK